MTITAKVIADSAQQSPNMRTLGSSRAVSGGYHSRLTTFVLKYPRFIHAEFMTHRVFSRNASSSRAIPVKTMIQKVIDDPAMPVYWGKNQAGMQAREELDDSDWDIVSIPGPVVPSTRQQAKNEWLKARDEAIVHVNRLMDLGLHKQIANRILEPWMHIEVVCTATDFANFYALRNHPDAQPEIQALANAMLDAHAASKPILLRPGQWHLPFIDPTEYADAVNGGLLTLHPDVYRDLARRSAACCARVSYLKHDGTAALFQEDLALYERLMGGKPKHASPTEHQAKVPESPEELGAYPSNLKGWVQFRKLHEGETVKFYSSSRWSGA